MEPTTVARAAEIILTVSDRLAELLVQLEKEPIDPDAVELDLLKRDVFNAYVRLDARREGGAVVELGPRIVIDIVDALRTVEWNFLESRAAEVAATEPQDTIEPILELALEWVILHEMAHWGLGHLGYRASITGETGARLSCADNIFESCDDPSASNPVDAGPEAPARRDLSSDEYRCIELQADFTATMLLDILHEEPDDEPDDADHSSRSDLNRIPASRQVVALAAGIAVLLVQKSRGKRAALSDLRHPSPEARALNVMSVLLAQNLRPFGIVEPSQLRIPIPEDEHVEQVRQSCEQMLRMFYRYLAPLAEAIGVEPIFSDTTLVAARMEETPDDLVPATARDLMVFILEPDATPDRFATAGGRELAALRLLNFDLMKRVAPFAVWSF